MSSTQDFQYATSLAAELSKHRKARQNKNRKFGLDVHPVESKNTSPDLEVISDSPSPSPAAGSIASSSRTDNNSVYSKTSPVPLSQSRTQLDYGSSHSDNKQSLSSSSNHYTRHSLDQKKNVDSIKPRINPMSTLPHLPLPEVHPEDDLDEQSPYM